MLAPFCFPLSSSKTVELTESESEFGVSCVKHIYPQHIVFQFNVTNTLEGQWIDNVSVELELGGEWNEELAVACPSLATGAAGVAFVCVARPDGCFALESCAATLKYTLKDAEDDAGFPDECVLILRFFHRGSKPTPSLIAARVSRV